MDATKEQLLENILDEIEPGERPSNRNLKARAGARSIVDNVFQNGHVLITTYSGMRIYRDYLIARREWGYCVLDEGHKIRIPILTFH